SLDPTLDAAIELFPNPAKDEATVRFALAERRDLNIKLVNALGQVLQNNIVTRATSGFVTLKLTDLPTGAYTVVVTDNDRLARRVLIID
ncbi:MAG: T9SS type A sorting domain-containing protein, partial [Bacteroidota bacterium]